MCLSYSTYLENNYNGDSNKWMEDFGYARSMIYVLAMGWLFFSLLFDFLPGYHPISNQGQILSIYFMIFYVFNPLNLPNFE